jgi:O-antigen ligase
MSLGKIIQRLFLYVGIALGVLAVFAAVIIFTKGGGHVSAGWFGLVGYTCLLFWVTMRQTREHWQRAGYWFTVGGLLVVHSLAFVAILRAYLLMASQGMDRPNGE